MNAKSGKSMEAILIEEVQSRPEIYDKSTAGYRNPRQREESWKQVAQAVDCTDIEAVKKRWRTLRDSFIKLHRTLKYNPKQVIKWLYYKHLTFLIPHTELADSKQASLDDGLRNESDETQDTVYGEAELDSASDYFVPEDIALSNLASKRHKRISEDAEDQPLTKKNRTVRIDSDEQFLLSCVTALKRLRPRENAIARMRIQQVLFETEFGGEAHGSGVLISKQEVEND